MLDPQPGNTGQDSGENEEDGQAHHRPPLTGVVTRTAACHLQEEAQQPAGEEELGGEWVSRKSLVEKAKEAGITKNVLDETLKCLQREAWLAREDRKTTNGRGGKEARFRRTAGTETTL